MELHEIKAIHEVSSGRAADAYLQAGWTLLATVSDSDGNQGWIRYSMGWSKDLPAKVPEGY